MTEDRIKKLEAICGWVWLSRGNPLVWDVRLPELQTDRNLSQVKQVGSRVYARYTNKQVTMKSCIFSPVFYIETDPCLLRFFIM
jgi:hypothetical protein